ncbi:MAG: TetR/AcrR family transcriptional regulator [Acidimicrobiales bacterium]
MSTQAKGTRPGARHGGRSKKQLRRELEDEISRRFILDAAETVFARQGFQTATIREIAAESEFSPSALYNFFESKEDLFAKVMERKGRDIVQQLQEVADRQTDPLAQLHALADTQIHFWSANRDFYRMLVRTASPAWWTLKAELDETSNDRFLRAIDIVAAVIRRGQQSGVFVPEDADTLAVIFLGILQAYLARWLSEKDGTRDGLSDNPDESQAGGLHELLDRAFSSPNVSQS